MHPDEQYPDQESIRKAAGISEPPAAAREPKHSELRAALEALAQIKSKCIATLDAGEGYRCEDAVLEIIERFLERK